MRYLMFLTAMTIGLVGCANLEVKVAVLDKAVIEKIAVDDLITNTMKQLSVQDSQSIESMFNDIKNEHYQAYNKMKLDLELKLNSEIDTRKKDAITQSIEDVDIIFSKTVTPEYQRLEKKWNDSVKSIQNLYAKFIDASNKRMKADYRNKLSVAIEGHRGLKTQLEKYIRHDLNTLDQVDIELKQQVVAKAKEEITELFSSGGLIHSDYAYYVASAPSEEWADPYDQSFGQGYFGNVDVAIKAIGQGNFTVKGLSFNPSDIASMASKVTSQSIILAAQIAGVPINIQGAPQGSGASLASSSSRIHSALAKEASLELQLEGRRDALLKIAQAILDERDNISGGDVGKRKQAIDSITAVYNSQAKRLNVSMQLEEEH